MYNDAKNNENLIKTSFHCVQLQNTVYIIYNIRMPPDTVRYGDSLPYIIVGINLCVLYGVLHGAVT